MERSNVAKTLIHMIDQVAKAPSFDSGQFELLHTFLVLFNFDQAAICAFKDGKYTAEFAIDRTKKILNPDQLWLSQTLLSRAQSSLQPMFETSRAIAENGIPKSISENRVHGVVCIPLASEPSRFVYMASQSNPLREYSADEMNDFKTAAKAAYVALIQQQCNQTLKAKTAELESVTRDRSRTLLYASPLMSKCLSEAKRVAAFNVSIFIQGESGSGKEELAREIHALSGRGGPFVAINCANLSETLLESELFGYAKGAFTGATHAKKGLIQEADGGTFFFDEIAELPLNIQNKLLRVVQERKVRPLGAIHDEDIDVRFLSASHVDLINAVRDKKFRQDLFYRIQEFTIEVPQLRRRMEDIELLAHFFMNHFVKEFKMPDRRLSPEALELLRGYSWPGNVRELKNVMRTAVIICNDTMISPQNLRLTQMSETCDASANQPADVLNSWLAETSNLRELSRRFEQEIVQSVLRRSNNQSEAAQRLGISVRTLQRILTEDEMAPDELRGSDTILNN